MSRENVSTPTPWTRSTANGLYIRDPLAWVYRVVPTEIIAGADAALRDEGAEPLVAAMSGLASKSRDRVRRYASKSAYRQFHLLSLSVPAGFEAPAGRPELASFTGRPTNRRVTFLGTQLVPRVAGGGPVESVRRAVNEVHRVIFEPGEFDIDSVELDLESVTALMGGARLQMPSRRDRQMVQAWWNWGRWADTPYLPHHDHVHVFHDSAVARIVEREDGWAKDCTEWCEMSGQHALSFAAVYDWDDDMYDSLSSTALWGDRLFQAGAVAVSIRGLLEPARVTRNELSTRKKRIVGDIQDRSSQGKLSRVEESELLEELSFAEQLVAGRGALPTMTDTVVTVAFSGMDYDWEALSNWVGVKLKPLDSRQRLALTEVQPCSPVIANPHRHDLSLKVVSHAGLTSLAKGGDSEGALLGFTSDKQPSWVSPVAASAVDARPSLAIVGATRSGKATSLNTPIPVPLSDKHPTGWTRMGDIEIGDTIFGRNGHAITVTGLSPINPEPELYEVELDDGQVIKVCVDHRWAVSSIKDRHAHKRPKRRIAHRRWQAEVEMIDRISTLASTFSADHESTFPELLELLATCGEGALAISGDFDSEQRSSRSRWTTASTRDILRRSGAPFRETVISTDQSCQGSLIKRDPVKVVPVAEALRGLMANAESLTGTNAVRWSEKAAVVTARCEELLSLIDRSGGLDPTLLYGPIVDAIKSDPGAAPLDEADLYESVSTDPRSCSNGRIQHATASEIGRLVDMSPSSVARSLSRRGASFSSSWATVVVTLPRSKQAGISANMYSTTVALKSVAALLTERAGDEPNVEVADERVLTTGEMLAEGVRIGADQRCNFSIRVPEPFDVADVELPVDPYVLGAWLGDGTSNTGVIAAGSSTSNTDPETSLADHGLMIQQIESAGYTIRRIGLDRKSGLPITIFVNELSGDLDHLGVRGNKHIPAAYLRASRSQRLALLQGLMDTDGHITKDGHCELGLSDERLIADALELIRSLGIKARIKTHEHSYRHPDDEPGVRRKAKDRHRIHFTTTLPVFRLPRKADRLPVGLGESAQNLYITDIRPIPTEPARCITVDAPDSMWLVSGFVPTHNTMAAQWLSYQWVNMGRPVIFVNPKQDDDLTPFAEACGGNVVWLDRLMSADGVLDPFRYADGEASASLALAFISAANPYGSREVLAEVEPRLSAALRYGADRGGSCIGEVLDIAVRDGRLEAEHRDRIAEVAGSQPLFRLGCGWSPTSSALRATDTLTLIQMGSTNLDLPAPGQRAENLSQRVSVAALRLLVFGAAYALRRRKGVLIFDEAWTFFTGDAAGEMDRLGRLAASQDFLPVALTQKVTDLTAAGQHNYISRVLAFALPRDEAIAACTMLGVDATEDRIAAFTADPEYPNSLKAQIERDTRNVLRPARCFYRDLDGKVTQVRVEIPPDVITEFSTNPEDRRRRAERLALGSGAA